MKQSSTPVDVVTPMQHSSKPVKLANLVKVASDMELAEPGDDIPAEEDDDSDYVPEEEETMDETLNTPLTETVQVEENENKKDNVMETLEILPLIIEETHMNVESETSMVVPCLVSEPNPEPPLMESQGPEINTVVSCSPMTITPKKIPVPVDQSVVMQSTLPALSSAPPQKTAVVQPTLLVNTSTSQYQPMMPSSSVQQPTTMQPTPPGNAPTPPTQQQSTVTDPTILALQQQVTALQQQLHTLHHPPTPTGPSDPALAQVLLSWYHSGYYTGRYHANIQSSSPPTPPY